MTNATESKGAIRRKSFQYRTGIEWAGGRGGTLRSEGKKEFRVASPPEFKGEEGVWSPEDLFVAAVESCTMTTFLSFAEKAGLSVISYRSRAEGLLEYTGSGYQFTRVEIRPRITVVRGDSRELAAKLVEDAHRNCLIANSIHSEVTVTPEIVVMGE